MKLSAASENSGSRISDPNSDILEEPNLDDVIDNSPAIISNPNMTNPEYEAHLTEINLAEIDVNNKVE